MNKISRAQAKILRHLLNYGEIRQRDGGYFSEEGDHIPFKALNGLVIRELLSDSIRHTMPSCGLISSPVFYDSSVTEKGKDAFRQFVAALKYPPDFQKDWNTLALEKEEDVEYEWTYSIGDGTNE